MARYHNAITILLLLAISSAPLTSLEFPFGHDWLYELVRVSEFRSALLNGQLAPYWGENLYGGFGSPIFLFYAPLYAFTATALTPLAGSIPSAGALALVVVTLAGLVFMSLFLREYLRFHGIRDEHAVRVGLYLFALSPYLLGDKFLRNANAEYTALCITPLALYGVVLISRKPWHGLLVLAAGLALTVVSHNLTALIAFSVVLIMAAGMYAATPRGNLRYAIAGMVLGLGISAYFWLPALAYKSLVRINQLTEGKFDFHWQYKSLAQSFGYDTFFSSGALAPALLLAALLMVYLARHDRQSRRLARTTLFVIAIAALLVLLQTPASTPLWESIYFLQLFQFPWRMMGPFSLAAAIGASLLFVLLRRLTGIHHPRSLELALLLLCLLNALPHLLHSKTIPERNLPEQLHAESIRQHALPATVADEYLPRWANRDLLESRRPASSPVVAGDGTVAVTVAQNDGGKIALHTQAHQAGRLHLARWSFPSWGARLDGERTELSADRDGLLTVEVPAGSHYLEVFVRPPPLRQLGSAISLLSLLVLLGLPLAATVRLRRPGASASPPTR